MPALTPVPSHGPSRRARRRPASSAEVLGHFSQSHGLSLGDGAPAGWRLRGGAGPLTCRTGGRSWRPPKGTARCCSWEADRGCGERANGRQSLTPNLYQAWTAPGLQGRPSQAHGNDFFAPALEPLPLVAGLFCPMAAAPCSVSPAGGAAGLSGGQRGRSGSEEGLASTRHCGEPGAGPPPLLRAFAAVGPLGQRTGTGEEREGDPRRPQSLGSRGTRVLLHPEN